MLFRYFDTDENNFITSSDVRLALAREGRKIMDNDVDTMINEVSSKIQGKIDFEDFEKMMYSEVDSTQLGSQGSDSEN